MEMTDVTDNRIRVDKWLWTVRIYKSRSKATEACEQGRILIKGMSVKPSRLIKPGDEIHIKRPGLIRKLLVVQIPPNRVGAKLAPDFVKDITPEEDIKAYLARTTRITIYRDPGTGRPTKQERRALDDFLNKYEDEEHGDE
jgi:ribosome-associated heat shock protein Hsp15